MSAWIITVNLPGYLPNGDNVEPFEAELPEALDALLDEAEYQSDHEHESDDDECESCSDEAFIASLRRGEGRGDALFALTRERRLSIRLDGYANSFGLMVELHEAEAE